MNAWIAATALLSTLLAGPSISRAEEVCLSDWSIAAPIVRREGLVTVEQLSGLVRQRFPGDIIKTSLCEGGGAYAFHIVIRTANGRLRSVVLDARKPFGP
ncbi:MAG: hypothetical protein WC807_13705 [Hyphomicrobium sp.]|jgi:uncharacterized membrane protein YkoI